MTPIVEAIRALTTGLALGGVECAGIELVLPADTFLRFAVELGAFTLGKDVDWALYHGSVSVRTTAGIIAVRRAVAVNLGAEARGS